MQCPPELSEIVCEILRAGLLRIRAFGWGRDPARCAIEADHLHNLPSLLESFDQKRLDYYWFAERPSFIEQSTPESLCVFDTPWKLLAKHVSPEANSVPVTSKKVNI